ncbi:MAG: hypothetical protein ABT14_19025 [Pelagibacterium sp. SCN 63-17]|nr:MAG: hypothetical protein ABT14_19025 [Pelagibacterium sp. SCN 63-17]
MASGRQIAEENVRKLQEWADEPRRPEDWAAFVKNGQLNRSAVAAACGFGRSVFAQNPAAKALIADIESQLIDRGVLSAASTQTSSSVTEPSSTSSRAPAPDDKVRRLEQDVKRRDERIATLMAEITTLRTQLRRLEHVEQSIHGGRRIIP